MRSSSACWLPFRALHDELEILELSLDLLSWLRCGGGASGHAGTPVSTASRGSTAADHPGRRASLTLKLRENLAPSAGRYKGFARIDAKNIRSYRGAATARSPCLPRFVRRTVTRGPRSRLAPRGEGARAARGSPGRVGHRRGRPRRAARDRCAARARARRGTPASELAHLLARRPPDGVVRRDDADALGVRFSAASRSRRSSAWAVNRTCERTDRTLLAGAVEDDDAARPAPGDEAREHVDELVAVGERPCVKQVVAVEEVEGRLSHRRTPR